MASVLQNWVMELPLRQQGVLILALRGPDGVRKESPTKPIVRTLRALVMVSGREGKPMQFGTYWRDDTFMNTRDIMDKEAWDRIESAFFADVDSYNLHFYQHLIHAFAVVGINFPNDYIKSRCWAFYEYACMKLHMHPETAEQFVYRLRDGERPEADQ